jgi:hypothetical protein
MVQMSYDNEYKRVKVRFDEALAKEKAQQEAVDKEKDELFSIETLKKEKAKKRKLSKENADKISKKSQLSKSRTFVNRNQVQSRLYQSNLSTRLKANSKFVDKENESRLAYQSKTSAQLEKESQFKAKRILSQDSKRGADVNQTQQFTQQSDIDGSMFGGATGKNFN